MLQTTYPITFIRKRVRCLRITVRRDGQVVVSVPWLTPIAKAEAFVIEKEEWIKRTRERLLSQPARMQREITKEQCQALIEYLTQAVEYWRIRMGEAPIEWKLRNMRSQWGNCRYQRRLITFNLQLALVSHDLVDYIIVHELAHLRVHNHGPLFHQRVQEFIPDEKERRKRLRMSKE